MAEKTPSQNPARKAPGVRVDAEKPAMPTVDSDAAAAAFAGVAAHHRTAWTPSASPKFGTNALRSGSKIYAALTRRRQLLLKLPPRRIEALLAAGRAERFVSGGRTITGWVVLMNIGRRTWIALSVEARAFVAAVSADTGRTRRRAR